MKTRSGSPKTWPTVDALSRGRPQVGLSAGAPLHGALLGNRFHDTAPNTVDFTHKRVGRLKANLEDVLLGDEETVVESAGGRARPRVQPYAAGLLNGCGTGAARCARSSGRGATASTCCWAMCCRARPRATS